MFGRHPWLPLFTILSATCLAGVILALLGDARSSTDVDTWARVSTAGVEIAVITVLGAVVTVAFRIIDARRARDDQRRQVLGEVVATYNRVKAVRRNLRALGLLRLDSAPIGASFANELRAQMTALNEAQLGLEAIKREVKESRLFIRNLDDIVDPLDTAETFLGKVLKPWEIGGGKVWEGSRSSTLASLDLERFIGDKRVFPDFETNVSKPLDTLTDSLHAELFGKPPSSKDAGRDGAVTRAVENPGT
jgi:hypothetical protein